MCLCKLDHLCPYVCRLWCKRSMFEVLCYAWFECFLLTIPSLCSIHTLQDCDGGYGQGKGCGPALGGPLQSWASMFGSDYVGTEAGDKEDSQPPNTFPRLGVYDSPSDSRAGFAEEGPFVGGVRLKNRPWCPLGSRNTS